MKTLKPLTMEIAWRIADRCAARRGADVARPGDARREAVIFLIAALHKVGAGGWDLEHARQNVSVTLPSMRWASIFSVVPMIGGALEALARAQSQATIYPSPAASATPQSLLDTLAHELGHLDEIAEGGPLWCACYGLVAEVRVLGAEAPCYGQGVIVRHAMGEGSPHDLCEEAMNSLKGYNPGDEEMQAARAGLGIIERTLTAGGMIRGPALEVLNELRAEGVI